MTKVNGFHVADGPVTWDAYEHQPGREPARGLGLTNASAAIQRCACGGEIVVVRASAEDELVAAIATHQETPRHLTWRRRTIGGAK